MKHPQTRKGDIKPPYFKSEIKISKEWATQKEKRKQAKKEEKEKKRLAGETFTHKEFRQLKQTEKAAEKQKEEEEEQKKNKRSRKK